MDFVDWQGFLTRFASFGSEPTPARYLDLFPPRRDGSASWDGACAGTS
jgi:hypothetical protein